MSITFPRTTVGGVSLPRILMGTNWLMGYSHRSPAADMGIRERYATPEAYFPVLEAYLNYGIDAIMGPFSGDPLATAAIKYAEDKTVIFISHRLSTTRHADRIYMFDGGTLAECGSHEELIAQGGKYAYMFNLQAEKYRKQE